MSQLNIDNNKSQYSKKKIEADKNILDAKLKYTRQKIKLDELLKNVTITDSNEEQQVLKDYIVDMIIRRFPSENVIGNFMEDNQISLKRFQIYCEEFLQLNQSLTGKRNIEQIDKEIQTATMNGDYNQPFFAYKNPTPTQKTLVIGCGHHHSLCPNHKRGMNSYSHYTVDINQSVLPDAIASINDMNLWRKLPNNYFTEVIIEGIGSVLDNYMIMNLIYNKMTNGAVLKTLHAHESLFKRDGKFTANAFLYKNVLLNTGKPLSDITYKDHLERIGFTKVEVFKPTVDEDKGANDYNYQIRAIKSTK